MKKTIAPRPIWYAVSALQAFQERGARQATVFENVYLVRAPSAAAAKRRGAAYARAEARAAGAFTVGEAKGRLAFVGVRKVLWCAASPRVAGPSEVRRLHEGVEASYSKFTIRTKDLKKLSSGMPVSVIYEE